MSGSPRNIILRLPDHFAHSRVPAPGALAGDQVKGPGRFVNL